MTSLAAEWIVLPHGQEVCIRLYQTEDRTAVRALFDRLSPRSLAQRFHSAGVRITEAILDLTTAGHALVAEVEGDIVGLASCRPAADRLRADAALVVDDAHQRRGIGTALCHRLTRDVQGLGIRNVRAGVTGDNHGMLKLLGSLALPMTHAWDQGVLSVEIQLRRDLRAAGLYPRSSPAGSARSAGNSVGQPAGVRLGNVFPFPHTGHRLAPLGAHTDAR